MSSGVVLRRSGPLAILEFLLLIGSYLLPAYLWLGDASVTYLLYENGLSAGAFTAGALLALLYSQGLYGRRRFWGIDLALRLVNAIGVGFLLEASVFYIRPELALPLSVMIAGSGLSFMVLFISRLIYYGAVWRGLSPDHVLLVGATPVNRRIAARIQARPELGFVAVGYLDGRLPPGTDVEGVKVLGPLESLPDVRRNIACHRVIADIPRDDMLRLMQGGVSGGLEKPDRLYESLFSRICSLHPTDLLFDNQFAPARFWLALQAVYTNLAALLALVVFGPVIVALALYIRLSSGGPAFETQVCTGWNLVPFTRLRFCCRKIVKTEMGEESVLTGAGQRVQQLRLQGLPQLFNLLRGEMALVGPPPLRAEFAAALIQALPYYRLAYLVKPGLVSWSRLQGAEGDVIASLEYDLHYIKSLSPSLDFSILAEAMSQPRSGSGAAQA